MSNPLFDTSKSLLQSIEHPLLIDHGIKLFIKRDDLIHEHVSGNKWRKLKFNLLDAKHNKRDGIVTFGGAFSNHLVASAFAAKSSGLKSVGIVRGEELSKDSNETLMKCSELGMELVFVPRTEYSLKNEKFYKEQLALDYPNHSIIPEGGANYFGMIGCQEILAEIKIDFDEIYVAQGTTTTSAGLTIGLNENQKINVVPVLKGFHSIDEMTGLFKQSILEESFYLEQLENVVVHSEGHFGGYGKYTSELLEFIQFFYREFAIKLDPIYTGKVMCYFWSLLKSGKVKNKTIVFIHTGGLQGSKGIAEKSGIKLY
jgi:1-aminocyclopropane-1-carboxylate deaminase